MTTHDTPAPIRDVLLDDIVEEIGSLDELELDAFLREIGEDPESTLEQGKSVRSRAIEEKKKSRLRAAQKELRAEKGLKATPLIAFSSERKREIFDRIKRHSEASGEMTLAARNRVIESEQDLDSFLEACLRLGLINEAGELNDEL